MIATLPSGYTITIDSHGLSLVKYAGGLVAQGPLQLIDGAWFFDQAIPHTHNYTPTIATKSIRGTVVKHTYTGALAARVVYTYAIEGCDVCVTAHVTNDGDRPMQPGFRSPRCLFASWADAYANASCVGDQSQTRNVGPRLSYPSVNVPLAAMQVHAVATSNAPINLCVWSREDPIESYHTMAFGVHPLPGIAFGSVFFQDVPVGGSRTYRWAYRFAASGDRAELLGGYKAHLRAARPLRYQQPDARPVAQFAHLDPSSVRPDNPYGYHDGGTNLVRRFDRPEGCAQYVQTLVPLMRHAGCQGLIAWQLQGIHPRGIMYRPDFDVFPTPVLANLLTLVQGFRDAGLTLGLLSRPGANITSGTWDTDTLMRMSADPVNLAELRGRFRWAMQQGFSSFYLDSFVSDGPDHHVLAAIRAEVGPTVSLFTEHQTALSLSESSAYLQLVYRDGRWIYPERVADLRALYPDAVWLTKFTGALPPGGYPALFDYMQADGLTPLVEDWLLMYNVDQIPRLLAERWRAA